MSLRDVLVEFVVSVKGQKDVADVDRSIKKATGSAKQLGSALGQMTAFYLGLRAVRAVRSFIFDTIDAAAALRRQAQTLGLTTDELQKYKYVADALHAPSQQVAFAFRFFNRAVGEAAIGTKSANKSFDALGIKIRDAHGQIKPTGDLLFEFADKMAGVKDQSLRTAYAMRTLGRGGAELLPLLQNGSGALRDMFKDVEDLGGGFNDAFVKEASEAWVYVVRLRMAVRALAVQITHALLPGMERWAYRITKFVKDLAIVGQKTLAFRTGLMVLIPVLTALGAKLLLMTRIGGQAWAWLKLAVASPQLIALVAIITTLYMVFDDLYGFTQGSDSVIGRLLDTTGAGNALKFFKELQKIFSDTKRAFDPLINAFENMWPTLERLFVQSLPGAVKWGAVLATGVFAVVDSAVSGLIQSLTLLKGLTPGSGLSIKQAWAMVDKENGDWMAQMKGLGVIARQLEAIDTGALKPPTTQAEYEAAYGPPGIVAGESPGVKVAPGQSGTFGPVNIHVEVNGGPSNGHTAAAVTKAVTGAVKDAATSHRDTWAAVNRGNVAGATP